MNELKQIALELLEKYSDAQYSVIYEYSCSIEKDLEELQKECDTYKAKINAIKG